MNLSEEQVNARDFLIFGKYLDWSINRHGIRYFEDMPAVRAEDLLKQSFMRRLDCYNSSPEVGELVDWALENTDPVGGLEITFDGYVVSPFRDDYDGASCVVLTAIVADWRNMEGLREKLDAVFDFVNAWHGADDFDVDENRGRAWWD